MSTRSMVRSTKLNQARLPSSTPTAAAMPSHRLATARCEPTTTTQVTIAAGLSTIRPRPTENPDQTSLPGGTEWGGAAGGGGGDDRTVSAP